jgi:hypothetical protein
MTLRILAISVLVALPQLVVAQNLTLEQIMADPDWLGNPPENAYWGCRQPHDIFRAKTARLKTQKPDFRRQQ